MLTSYSVAAVTALMLTAYLAIALMKPEWFA